MRGKFVAEINCHKWRKTAIQPGIAAILIVPGAPKGHVNCFKTTGASRFHAPFGSDDGIVDQALVRNIDE